MNLEPCKCILQMLADCAIGAKVACHMHGIIARMYRGGVTLHCLGPDHARVRGRLDYQPAPKLSGLTSRMAIND